MRAEKMQNAKFKIQKMQNAKNAKFKNAKTALETRV
jgi:hypothetical protein